MERTLRDKMFAFMPPVAAGILVALSFPGAGLYPLAWFAFVPLLLSIWQKDWKSAFKSGFVFGICYFFGTLYWIYHSINHFGGISFLASIALVFLLCAYLSIFTAVFSSLFSLAYQKTALPALCIAPVLWVTLEFARSYALTGFPWSSIGYSQYRFLPLIQVADITGIYGISFILLALNGAFADLLLTKKRLAKMPLFPLSYTVAGGACLFCLVAAVLGYGYYRLHEQRPGNPFKISVVQGNIAQERKWEPVFQNEVMHIHEELTRKVLSEHPALIVWPETAIPFAFGSDVPNTERLLRFQKQTGTPLLFGSILVKSSRQQRTELTNSAILLNKEGQKVYSYDKIHLVPFGEYVPLRNVLFFVDKLVVGIGDYISGKQYLRAETDFGSFGTVICYEIIFPGLVRKFFIRGGDVIVTITNDAWFGRTAGPFQHFSMAVFRAIENRKPLVRAANTGISGFIDSNGRIISSSTIFTRQAMTETIITDRSLTFYTKFGDLFSYLCIVISIILSVNLFSRR